MFTADTIERFAALAGPEFAWDGVKGGDRPTSRKRAGFLLDLITRQGGICPACGEALDDTAEVNHVVARGPKRKGFMPGNVFAGHSGCNATDKVRFDVIPFTRFARPDLIPMEHTPIRLLPTRP